MRMRRLAAYILESLSEGRFPMAESAETDHLYFLDPHERAIFSPSRFHVPSRLRRRMRQTPFRVWIDSAFEDVLSACASPAPGRAQTWINRPICEAYLELHRQGVAHSVECWRDGALQGGLYGVAIGGAFFGESMFSRARDASKIALIYLAGASGLWGLLPAGRAVPDQAFGAVRRADRLAGGVPAKARARARHDGRFLRAERRFVARRGLAGYRPDIVERMLHRMDGGA